jgi:hypothetical protein
MTPLRLFRYWTLLLLLYVAADFMDPSIPGVFFFDSGTVLFVDGVVQLKANASTHLATPERIPSGGPADYDDKSAAARVRAVSRPSLPQRVPWKNLKHDDSASFASSSPPDSSPTPPVS